MSSIAGGYRRHWLKVVLLVLLIAESLSLFVLVLENYRQEWSYGSFQYGCSSLQASPAASNDSFVRWVRLTCPNGPAVKMSPSGYCGVRENPCTHIFPIFTPPPGLLGLYAVDHANPTCPDNSPYAGYLMVNGVGEIYGSFGFPATDLDYCAVTTASSGTIDEFSVQWSLGYGGLGPWFRSSFPSNVTVTHGGTATFTVTLTSYNQYSGNLSFATGQVSNEYASSPITPPTLSFSPQSVILKADGSNSTLVTIHTAPSTNLGSWRAQLFMTPVYGLWYYGGFTPAPYANANGISSYQASTIVYVT